MTRTNPAQLSFTGGEIDPLLAQRSDFARQQTGLAECNGFLPLVQGPVTRAPGTFRSGNTRNDGVAILVPFVFAIDDAVVLEFSDHVMRVWRYAALVTTGGGTPYELATPYPETALAKLQWVQSADVIYLCDGDHPVQRLERHALDNWTIAPATFDTGPFRVQNLNKASLVKASGQTGTITITKTDWWTSDQVGSLIMLEPLDATVAFWTAGEVIGSGGVSVGEYRRYDEKIYQLTNATGTTVGTNPPIHDEGTAQADKVTAWTYVSDGKGIARIVSISASDAVATVLRTIPKSCVDGWTYRWSEGAWSEKYGYPQTVELFQQRAVYAATRSEPRSLWFSTVGDFRDFLPSTEADGAFAYTIAGDGSVNAIQTLKRGRTGLHVFGLGEEWSTRSDSAAQVIGPTTAVIAQDSANGARPTRPIAPGGDPIFISRDGRRVLELSYQLQDDAKRATNLSLPAAHLGAAGFKQLAWQSVPMPIIWAVQDNGGLAALIYDQSEQVQAWATVSVAGGIVEAIAVSPAITGTEDTVTLIVRRMVQGVPKRFVERQAQIWGLLTGAIDPAITNHLFCARRFTPSTPTDSFDMSHLLGRAVYALTDLGQFGPITVPASGPNIGIVTLPDVVSSAVIGLFDASHAIETFDIPAASPEGNTMGRPKRLLTGMGLAVHRTAQGFVQLIERDFGRQDRIDRPVPIVPPAVASDVLTVLTGQTRIDRPGGHATSLAVRITPDRAAPLTISAIVPIVQEAGR